MKTLIALLNHPVFVLLNSMVGATAIAYLRDTAWNTFLWFVPCIFVIIADLAAGIRAARTRCEQVRLSTAMRRTGNKIICYFAWIVCCVALNERYNTQICAWIGVGFILAVEAFSFLTNILEPHGFKLSVSGILKVVGKKHNIDELDQIIEKNPKKEKK